MRDATKLWALILLLGTVVQAAGIWLFSATSTTRWSQVGKPIVLGATFAGIVALLLFAFKNRNKPATVVFIGIGFGAAYVLAFHAVGIAISPGLLRDADAQGYWTSLVRVFAAAVIIHTALAAAVFSVMRMGWLRTTRII